AAPSFFILSDPTALPMPCLALPIVSFATPAALSDVPLMLDTPFRISRAKRAAVFSFLAAPSRLRVRHRRKLLPDGRARVDFSSGGAVNSKKADAGSRQRLL